MAPRSELNENDFFKSRLSYIMSFPGIPVVGSLQTQLPVLTAIGMDSGSLFRRPIRCRLIQRPPRFTLQSAERKEDAQY
jgi:hypothetical protein